MTQGERDRLVALRKAKQKLITQREAAEELGLSIRQVKRLLKALKKRSDKAVIHGLRGRPPNHHLDEEVRQSAIAILRQEVYRSFKPTLASEYQAKNMPLRSAGKRCGSGCEGRDGGEPSNNGPGSAFISGAAGAMRRTCPDEKTLFLANEFSYRFGKVELQ